MLLQGQFSLLLKKTVLFHSSDAVGSNTDLINCYLLAFTP